MSNYIELTIIAFGNQKIIKKIKKENLGPKGLIHSVKRSNSSLIIECSYKIGAAKTIVEELFNQLEGLSIFFEVYEETGYAALYYKDTNQTERSMLFEILDCISNDFLENYDSSYLHKFRKIDLNWKQIDLLRKTNIGTAYTNLLINPNCYK